MRKLAVVLYLAATCLAGSGFASGMGSKYSLVNGKVDHAPPKTQDTILYSNGADVGCMYCADAISDGAEVSDSFHLGGPSTLNSVTFSNWFLPGDVASTVNWAITTQLDGGTTLASGVGALSLVFVGTIDNFVEVYAATFSLGGVNLGAGTYYLTIGNEQVTFGDVSAWGESDGPSSACQGDGYGACDLGIIPSESFSISGTGEQLPEPSSLILLGTGLLGAAGAIRRKFKV